MRASIVMLAVLTSTSASLISEVASAQGVFVYPRRPQQSRVRYFNFEWMHADILVGEEMAVKSSTLTASSSIAAAHAATDGAVSNALTLSHTSTETQEVLASSEEPAKAGGMRLYFYKQEETIAGRAAGSITDTYRE